MPLTDQSGCTDEPLLAENPRRSGELLLADQSGCSGELLLAGCEERAASVSPPTRLVLPHMPLLRRGRRAGARRYVNTCRRAGACRYIYINACREQGLTTTVILDPPRDNL